MVTYNFPMNQDKLGGCGEEGEGERGGLHRVHLSRAMRAKRRGPNKEEPEDSRDKT